jgi:DNA-binding Lrp family transcriptional regulator
MMARYAAELDEKDRRILLALETNGRQSAAEIGKKVRLSKEVVNYRIKKYLSSGIITKFFIIPNFDKLGFTTYRIYLQFLATTSKKEKEIIDYILEKMPCQWLGICDGRWDVIARITASDIFEFNSMMNAFFEKHGEFIKQKEITIQLRHTWWPSTYGLTEEPPEKKPKHEVPRHAEVVKYDQKDLKILSEMIEDARMPTVEIAKRVGLSPHTVNHRIKRLINEGVITQIKSYFNREKLGYQHNQVFLRLVQEPTGVKRFISTLNEFPECFFVSSMVGAWDMQFGIDARDSIEFHKLFGKIKEGFPNVILDYESLIVYKEFAPNPFKHFIKSTE